MGGSSVATRAPHGGRLGLGRFLPNRIRCTSLGIFCTFRFASAGFVTALSDRFRSGGRFPASSVIASILPGLLLPIEPVKCPLYARAIDIFGAAPLGTATAPCRLSMSRIQFKIMNLAYQACSLRLALLSSSTHLIHKAAHSNVHHHAQRQEHEQHRRPAVTH